MSKFKVGDKVKLKGGLFCSGITSNTEYTVVGVACGAVWLEGIASGYPESIFISTNIPEQASNIVSNNHLLQRIIALEEENMKGGLGNGFTTLKCLQGNRLFTKDINYCASNVGGRLLITHNFGGRKDIEEDKSAFGSYRQVENDNIAIFSVVGVDTLNPKLKTLDQSVFDGAEDWVKTACINPNGTAYLYSVKKGDFFYICDKNGFQVTGLDKCKFIGFGFDTLCWKDSVIEREVLESGRELCNVSNKPQEVNKDMNFLPKTLDTAELHILKGSRGLAMFVKQKVFYSSRESEILYANKVLDLDEAVRLRDFLIANYPLEINNE